MITEAFDRRTMARMQEALERACALLPGSGEHSARRMIANKIIECAQRGNTSLIELTEAGYAASLRLAASADDAGDHDESHAGSEQSEFMPDHV